MPWKIVKQTDPERWCIFKEDADGNPTGKTLGCHDTSKEAKDQLAALYANEPEARGIVARLWQSIKSLFDAELAPEPEPERALAMQDVYQQVGALLYAQESEGAYLWLNDIYDDAGQRFAVVSMGGKLYRAPLMIDGTTVTMGALQEVEAQFAPVRSRISVIRQADGKHRWFIVAGSAVLNRVGEIDSRALYDSFVANAQTAGYPTLRYYHDSRLDFGQADWTAREENTYLASGLLNEEHPLAQAFVDAIETGRGTWGASVGFSANEPPNKIEIGAGVTIPVYTSGVNSEISVLPENRAASWFTNVTEVTRMRKEIKDSLVTLFGDEERAKQFIDGVDATNRAIADAGLITRDDASTSSATSSATEVVSAETAQAETTEPTPAAEPAPAFVLDDAAIAAIAEKVKSLMPVFDPAPLLAQLTTLGQQLATVTARAAALEQSDDAKRKQWLADQPARAATTVTYRPRQEKADDAKEPSLADRAAATLASMPKVQ